MMEKIWTPAINFQKNLSGKAKEKPVNMVYHRLKHKEMMLICPFSIHLDPATNKFFSKTSKLRRVIIITMILATTVYIVWKAWISSSSNKTPIMLLFNIAIYTCWIFMHLVFTYTSIWQADKIIETLNQMRKVTDILREYNLRMCPRVCVWVPRLFTILITTYVLLDAFGLNVQLDDVGIKSLIPTLPRYKPGSVKESYNDTCLQFPCIPSDILGAATTISFFLANLYATTIIQTSNIIVAEYGISVWIIVRAYTDLLQKPMGSTSIQYKQKMRNNMNTKMLDILDEIVTLHDMINDTWGSSIAMACFGWLPFYVLKLVRIFVGWRQLFQYIYLYHIFSLFLIYVPAASSNARIKGISKWIKKLQKLDMSVSSTGMNFAEETKFNDRVQLVLYDISSPGIGIRGHVFTITYALIGEVLGLMITYTVILLQFEK